LYEQYIFCLYYSQYSVLWNVTDNPVVRMLWAAETGNIDIVVEMLNKDAGLISATDADGYTALHRASYEGHCQVVEVSPFAFSIGF